MKRGQEYGDWKKLIRDEARLRGYSGKTISSYTFHVGKFICSGLGPREYILRLIKKGCSDETVRSAGFAVKFFLKLQGRNLNPGELPNVKREKKLPVVLSREEIGSMVLSTKNINHRLIIQTAYSAGLRLSEIVGLRWEDIDFSRNLIHIRRAKGKKDRVVMLSPKVKKGLKRLDNEKEGLVFKTMRRSKYGPRSLQEIIKKAAKNAGIKKRVTPHTLRHSFATHLLERGTDIRYIKELLGHSDVRTTLIYTKVSKRDITRIKSPLD